jgi:uncharacterized tellurite resistance protein B-like protein
MFFKKRDVGSDDDNKPLHTIVDRALPGADQDTRRIVVAIVGLCGVVAYADRYFSEVERASLTHLLGTLQGMDESKAAALVEALNLHIVEVSTTQMARHARTLLDLGDRDLRQSVLELLLDLAASDRTLVDQEVVVLRVVTKALGLDQSDYNRLQAKHRALLSALS